MEFKEILEKRQSIRKFDHKPVPKETLDAILEAGRKAPTAKNLQPQKIYVVTSEEGLARIDQASPCRYQAPVVLLVCGDCEAAWQKREDYNTVEMDCCIVATHMMLAACDEGIGSIWIERFDDEKVKQLFELPANIRPILLMPLGYPASDCPDNVNHHNRKPLTETVEYR